MLKEKESKTAFVSLQISYDCIVNSKLNARYVCNGSTDLERTALNLYDATKEKNNATFFWNKSNGESSYETKCNF